MANISKLKKMTGKRVGKWIKGMHKMRFPVPKSEQTAVVPADPVTEHMRAERAKSA